MFSAEQEAVANIIGFSIVVCALACVVYLIISLIKKIRNSDSDQPDTDCNGGGVRKIYIKAFLIFLTPFIFATDIFDLVFRPSHDKYDTSLSDFWTKASGLELLAWSFLVLISYLLVTFLWRVAVAVEKSRGKN